MDDLFAYPADIGENTDRMAIALDQEAMRICCIVVFAERGDGKVAYFNALPVYKGVQQAVGYSQFTATTRSVGEKNRKLVFVGHDAEAFHVIGMLMRHEDGLYILQGEPLLGHAFLDLAARYAGIHQYGFAAIAHVVTIAIAARSD